MCGGGGVILPVPSPQNGPLKSPPTLGLNNAFDFPHAPTALSVGTGDLVFPKSNGYGFPPAVAAVFQ